MLFYLICLWWSGVMDYEDGTMFEIIGLTNSENLKHPSQAIQMRFYFLWQAF